MPSKKEIKPQGVKISTECAHITEDNRCMVDINFGWLGCNNNIITESSYYLWDKLGGSATSARNIKEFIHNIFDNRKCDLDKESKILTIHF